MHMIGLSILLLEDFFVSGAGFLAVEMGKYATFNPLT